jgi:hypothetical protein
MVSPISNYFFCTTNFLVEYLPVYPLPAAVFDGNAIHCVDTPPILKITALAIAPPETVVSFVS